MKQLYIYILAIFSFYSCNSQSNDKNTDEICTMSMQNEVLQETKISSILGEPQIIHLSTNNDSYIGALNKAIELDEYIYILSDFKQLLKFDKQGNSIFKIFKLGRGKGEYTNIFDFDIYKNEIFVTTRTNRIIVYNALNGDFIREIILNKDCSAITVANDKLYCEAIAKGPSVNLYTLEGNAICEIGDNSKNPPVMSPVPFVKINDNHIGYTVFNINNIIEINTTTDSCYNSYITNLDNTLTIEGYNDIVGKHGKINEFGLMDVESEMDLHYCISTFRKLENKVFIAFYKGDSNYFGLSNIDNSENIVYNTSKIKDDLFGADINTLIDNTSYCISNQHIISYLQPHDIHNDAVKARLKINSNNDNPVIILFKFITVQ